HDALPERRRRADRYRGRGVLPARARRLLARHPRRGHRRRERDAVRPADLGCRAGRQHHVGPSLLTVRRVLRLRRLATLHRSVGATTKDDQVADFSNVAPFLSLFAPGVSIISSFAGGGFAIASGTSMAAPHVAGTWAVLKQAKPTANVDEILQALTGTGVMIEDTLAGTGTTRPRIQVDLALSALLNPGVPIISGISPKRGTLGTSLTVTVNGINFEPGATASFGADVTVTSMTVVSSTQLSVAL